MIKDTNEQLNDEIRRARSWRVLNEGISVPWSWAASPSQVYVFTNLEALQTPYHCDFMEASSCRMINYLLHFQLLCSLWRMGVGAETSKLLVMAWSFW